MTVGLSFNTYEPLLKNELTTTKLDSSFFPALYLEQLKINASGSAMNLYFHLDKEDLHFHFIEIIRDKLSERYFDVEEADFFDLSFSEEQEAPILYVVFEKTLGIIDSNSNRLLVEIFMKQGIEKWSVLPIELTQHLEAVKEVSQSYR